jgi:hypothetical protein
MHPSAEAIEASVAAAYSAGLQQQGGANADYIPYLAKVPSQLFGIAVMTVDSALFTAGDSGFAFALESISKVFTLAHPATGPTRWACLPRAVLAAVCSPWRPASWLSQPLRHRWTMRATACAASLRWRISPRRWG